VGSGWRYRGGPAVAGWGAAVLARAGRWWRGGERLVLARRPLVAGGGP
jgi:hypothetical protein